jgi:4a-hydroxytetrahydrobiopterin dehydratase
VKQLSSQKCRPCEGGVQPLGKKEVREQLSSIDSGWVLSDDGKNIIREFDFPSFARTIAFANAIAWISTVEGHHPEMLVRYNTCRVSYRTTAIDGLSENDFICAAKVDQLVGSL